MSEASRRPSEQFPVPEAPENDVEKGADVLPIRPDIVVQKPDEAAISEEEAKKVTAEIREINARLTRLRQDQDALREGLTEDTMEAGRQILAKNWFSRLGGMFSRNKEKKPIVYDEQTRSEVMETKREVEQQLFELSERRRVLAWRLNEEQRRAAEAEWQELDRIYEELRREEGGE